MEYVQQIEKGREPMAASEPLPPTLTVERAAEILGISRQSAYEGVRRGEIPSLRVGRRVIVPTAQLMRLLGVEEAVRPSALVS
jgi:excisionase family DNA binding protein